MKVKTSVVKKVFISILVDRNEWGCENGYTYDEETTTFYDSDNEIEYQLREYGSNQFKSLLIRFSNDTHHIYREITPEAFDYIEQMIYYALDEVLEELIERMEAHK